MFARALVLATATVVLAACGTAPMPGARMVAPGAVIAAGKAKAAPAAKAIDFGNLVVNEVVRLRDGGTIVAKGYVTRSTYVTIKLDGALNSRTRGGLFVESHEFQQAEGEFRRVEVAEHASLAKGLASNVARAGSGLDVQALNTLIEYASKAPANETPGTITSLVIEKLPVRCPCFELKAKYDDKALVIKFEGMPGGYTIEAVTLDGKPSDANQRQALAFALEAAADQAGSKAMMVRDLAEALAAAK